jgi:ribosome maturation factor RimP
MQKPDEQSQRPSPLGADLQADLQLIAAEGGCELIHTELKSGQLRFVLDHPDGVTIAHCASFSRQASALLDVDDFGEGRYTLEVTSPGLDRQLHDRQDYERFVDHRVRVRFQDTETGGKRTIVGRLQSFAEVFGGAISVLENDHEDPIVVPLNRVEIARLEIEI